MTGQAHFKSQGANLSTRTPILSKGIYFTVNCGQTELSGSYSTSGAEGFHKVVCVKRKAHLIPIFYVYEQNSH